jgi:arylsulfatase B
MLRSLSRCRPTFRGYNSFLGFYSGGEDYFSHEAGGAFDFHNDSRPECGEGCSQIAWELGAKGSAPHGVDPPGQYSTIVFAEEAVRRVESHPLPQPFMFYLAFQAVHAPGEAPKHYVNMYKDSIADSHRRMFAGMLTCADEGIGNVTTALKGKGMLKDTIIVITTDNGGPVPDTPGGDYVGSRNFPLRGGKVRATLLPCAAPRCCCHLQSCSSLSRQ